jgi:hypothetical protein
VAGPLSSELPGHLVLIRSGDLWLIDSPCVWTVMNWKTDRKSVRFYWFLMNCLVNLIFLNDFFEKNDLPVIRTDKLVLLTGLLILMNFNRPTNLPISIPGYRSYWPICRFSTCHIWNLNSEQFSTNFISFHNRSDSRILLTVPPAAQFHNWLFLPISYESAAPVPFSFPFPHTDWFTDFWLLIYKI